MLDAVRDFEPKVAAGWLSKAALSLGYGSTEDTSSDPRSSILEKIYAEARYALGIKDGDFSRDSIELIADYLDEESDKLLDAPDIDAALARLARRGDLASDLYEISIIPNVADVYGRHFANEKKIIELTIKDPDAEQHFGPGNPNIGNSISLFQRLFRTKFPLKDFIMLVAADRKGLILEVHQAWRIYPSKVDLLGAEKPVDLLQRFAGEYGVDAEIEGKKSSFFLRAGVGPSQVRIHNPPGQVVMVSYFRQLDSRTGKQSLSLIVAINQRRYQSLIKHMGVRNEDMLDPL